jgi:hypothetical protein
MILAEISETLGWMLAGLIILDVAIDLCGVLRRWLK